MKDLFVAAKYFSLVTLCVSVIFDEALQSDLGDKWNKVQTVHSDSSIITSESHVSSQQTADSLVET